MTPRTIVAQVKWTGVLSIPEFRDIIIEAFQYSGLPLPEVTVTTGDKKC
jgi:hypothetical protein